MNRTQEDICQKPVEYIRVQTKEGPIRGYVDANDDGTYYKFKSIPFGKPPLGQLRFLPPQPVTPWTEQLDCTKDSPTPVYVNYSLEVAGSEDCLYLEVTTPNIQPDKPMPVMFWMPSMGFGFLTEHNYDPSLINDQEVVYVCCNARVGPFGFLSINDISAPGNVGLKDLVAGLKWVQRNISAFGGDANNVTIFGTSSGGSMVHLMMLSPMATGLFHKAIIQSGTSLNNWSLDKNPTAAVTELANYMGIQETCMVTLVEKLKNRPKDEIMSRFVSAIQEFMYNLEHIYVDLMFKPSIEQEYEGQQAFLTKSPLMIIKSGNFNKVPFIIGSNSKEAQLTEFVKTSCFDYKDFYANLRNIVPKPLAVEESLEQVIGEKILKFYTGEDYPNENSKSQHLQVMSDFFFIYNVTKTVQLHSTIAPECPIYYYILTYAGEWVLPKNLEFFNTTGHHGEIPFIFRIKLPGSAPCMGSRDSVATRSKVVKMWTNFAKYSNPTPDENDPLLRIKWDPVENENKLNYLCIGPELTKGQNPFRDRIAFWDDLLKQHQSLKIFSCFQGLGMGL